MGKKKVVWTRRAEIQMFAIMDYYAERNKSDDYSLKLYEAIELKLSKVDFTVSIPQKSAIENIFYLVHNHRSVFFTLEGNTLFVVLVWDERRNPNELLESLYSL